MDFEKLKITEEEIENNGVCSAADSLNGTARENKERFDKLPKFIAERFNNFVDECGEMKSEIDNAGYITESAIPQKVSELENDNGFITGADVPKKVSQLENDAGFITESSLPKKLSEIENDTGYITETAIPEKLSEFENDTGYITDEALPKKVSQLENDCGYITSEGLSCDTKYDTVIRSQEEWDEMVASENWNGARNILIMTRINISPATSGGDALVPVNVLCIDGNGHTLLLGAKKIIAEEGANTSLRNFKPIICGSAGIQNINGIYNCSLEIGKEDFGDKTLHIKNCKNIIGCKFSSSYDISELTIEGCDTIILDTASKEHFDSLDGWELVNCTNVIYEKTKLSEFDNDKSFITAENLQAENISYKNTASGLEATDVKTAIDELAKMVGISSLPSDSWENVQQIVRLGLASKVYAIGDQLVCNHKTYGQLVWDIIDIKPNCLTLQLHDCLKSLQYDAVEALYYADEELPAGTYNFTVLDGSNNRTLSFTLTKPIPQGGVIMFPWHYGNPLLNAKISTYENRASTTAIQSVSVTESADGISLESIGKCNDLSKFRYGSSNWSESAVRQFLNSDAGAGEVWTPQTNFDRPPSWNSTTAGFLNGLDKDFLAVIGEVVKEDHKDEFTTEKFFLLDITEVYGESSTSDIMYAYPYYKNNSDLSYPGMSADSNRVKYKNGSTRYWWLRDESSGNVAYVDSQGAIAYGGADSLNAVVPVCCIV